MNAQALVLLALVALAACSSESPTAGETSAVTTPRALSIQVGAGEGGGSLLEFNGVQIVVGRSATLSLPAGFTLSITEGDGRAVIDQSPGPEVLVNGRVLDVLGGELFLGDETFGLMAAEDVVLIDGSGVRVNGEVRVGRPVAESSSEPATPR